jgi:hypothetical protein
MLAVALELGATGTHGLLWENFFGLFPARFLLLSSLFQLTYLYSHFHEDFYYDMIKAMKIMIVLLE